MQEYYDFIFKRKSFHLFRDIGSITSEELEDLKAFIKTVKPLDSGIKTSVKIVEEQETTCKRGAEYCILFYSEAGEYSQQNIGYMGEQIDLYLAAKNIGALWFGIGRPKECSKDSLDFVIMLAIAKMPEEKFRRDMFKAKRKPIEDIWTGRRLEATNIVRFAPSACNTQPWFAEYFGNTLSVFRYSRAGKRGIMPAAKVTYYNRIDLGIFLCFLEICLSHDNVKFERTLYADVCDDCEKALNAIYRIVPSFGPEVKDNIIAKLTTKDDKYACAIADKIISESRETDVWYEYFDDFAALLSHPKSLVRNRVLHILAANARWDEENRFDSIITDFLSHVTNEKPITARQCIKSLAQVGQAKPQYIPMILSCLHSADLSKYKDSMRPLIEKDIVETEKTLTL